MAFARTIIEEDAVSQEIDRFIATYPRIEELWEGWTWRLSRDPFTDATRVSAVGIDPAFFFLRTPYYNFYNLPVSLGMVYTFNDDEIRIVSVRIDVFGPS